MICSEVPEHLDNVPAALDVRTSNSAAMYLALMSYVANGNNIMQSMNQAQPLLPLLADMFLRQKLLFGPLALVAVLACLVVSWSRMPD